LQNITLTEAYDACETANAWGGRTSSTVRILVGPMFFFNNPRTQKTTTGGLFSKSTEWTYSNEAELLLPFIEISVQVSITCNRRIMRLEDNVERQDAGSISRSSDGGDTEVEKRDVTPSDLISNPNSGDGSAPSTDGRGIEDPVDVVVPVAPETGGGNKLNKKKPRKRIEVLKARVKAKAKAAAIKRAKEKAKAKKKLKLKNQ
jgi:hypothetical protein